MAQHHLEPLTAVDASFLHQEGDATHMHIGGVARFDGPPPSLTEFLDHVRARLALVPRYRQKLALPPAGLGKPRWVDDPTFTLDYHVRHTALPCPGDETALQTFAARMFSRRLDRGKPLWELWLVEDLEGDSFALMSKTHHALVDGVSGADLLTVLFDHPGEDEAAREDRAASNRAGIEPWEPRPEPSAAQLAADALGGAARTAIELPLRAASAVSHPGEALHAAREAAVAVGEVAAAQLVRPAPASPLNVEIGPHRRLAFTEARLADLKAIKDALGGTVNDVVLAITAGALRAWMHHRGLRTEGVVLRAGVPISTRAPAEHGTLGNRLAQVVAPLPVGIRDPVSRLHEIRLAMQDVKTSRQALGAEVIASAQGFAPPTILAQASRLSFSARLYNLLVMNVPGPQLPLRLLGRRMRDAHPIPFLAGERALAVAVMSYDGALGFGFLGDFDALPDLDVIAEAAQASLAELLELAAA